MKCLFRCSVEWKRSESEPVAGEEEEGKVEQRTSGERIDRI